MQRSTRLALATGFALTVGALLFILIGDGIAFLGGTISSSPAVQFGSSLVTTGYAIIVILVIILISVVAYLIYQHNRDSYSTWGGY